MQRLQAITACCCTLWQTGLCVLSMSYSYTFAHVLVTVFRQAEALAHADTLGRRTIWFSVTTGCIAFAAAVSYSFPFFSIVMAIIASLGDLMSMFGLPCLFAIKLLRMPKWEIGLCGVLAVVSVALSGCGIVSSVQQLIEAFQKSRSDNGGLLLAMPFLWLRA